MNDDLKIISIMKGIKVNGYSELLPILKINMEDIYSVKYLNFVGVRELYVQYFILGDRYETHIVMDITNKINKNTLKIENYNVEKFNSLENMEDITKMDAMQRIKRNIKLAMGHYFKTDEFLMCSIIADKLSPNSNIIIKKNSDECIMKIYSSEFDNYYECKLNNKNEFTFDKYIPFRNGKELYKFDIEEIGYKTI